MSHDGTTSDPANDAGYDLAQQTHTMLVSQLRAAGVSDATLARLFLTAATMLARTSPEKDMLTQEMRVAGAWLEMQKTKPTRMM